MYTITGSRISVLGSGNIGIIPTFYSPDADSGVIATKDLQKRGMMTIFPPGENSGVWIVDPTTGAIVIQGDKNYNINPDILHSLASAGDRSNNIVMSREEIKEVYGYNLQSAGTELDFNEYSIRTAKSKMTIYEKSIAYKVADLQRTYGFASKEDMLGYSRCIAGYPITEKDINKHFVKFPYYLQGHMTRSSFTSEPTLHQDALRIGDIVSTDCIKFSDHGCGAGGVQLFIDKKSNYAIGILTKGEGNAQQLSECFNNVKKFYASYNHKISIISGDSLPTYRSQEYESNINDNQSRRQESAPHEQQQNAVERFVRSVEEGITTMKASASWVPLKLIAFLIMLWICLWNLKEGSEPGISRYEEFTKRRPAIDAGARPGTYGDCYVVNKQKEERKGGHFGEAHGDLVMYLAPNSQSKDAHWFYKPDTDRVVSRRSYNRVSGIPSSWMLGNRSVGQVVDEDGTKWDFVNGPQQYDVWHLGATAEAVAMDTKAKYSLPVDTIVTNPTTFNELVTNQHQQTELQVLQPETGSYDTSITLEEVPLLDKSALKEVSPVSLNGVEEDPVGNRTRSSGPAEDLSVKLLKESSYYGMSSQQQGK
jgi:hypothetical protein